LAVGDWPHIDVPVPGFLPQRDPSLPIFSIGVGRLGQARAGKSVENVGKSLIFHSDPCKMYEEWNS
jgi:hypothetical protein